LRYSSGAEASESICPLPHIFDLDGFFIAGVVLIQSLQLTGFFQYGVRLVADTENYFTSVERNQAYARLPSEANPKSPPGLVSEEWPEKGKVEFVDYTMAYRVDLKPVLNNLTFTVKPQEKVGILGRTGAGKSSLAAALFRMVENPACSGSILIDGIDVKEVGLDDLRLRLSIIPQDPVLFRGTVRLNLDPFHRHADLEIHEALRKVELTEKIKSLDAGLDSTVTENGENFSVGQRQLLCLARCLLRKSKIIVMDEATAAVDGETDQLIQKTMKTMFHDCTVLTIAHRIDTVIDCDRVLVLAKGGRIAEFDSPLNLLRHAEQVSLSDNNSTTRVEHVFANMVAQGGPVAAKQLREAAEAAERQR
jgi:ABC-type multidrug transport system fused ATPase/permease subunit